MKRIGMMMVAFVASLIFVGGSLAAGNEATSKMSPKSEASAQKFGKIVSANRLIGMDINNQQGDKIGEVQDLALNRQSGQIDYIVVSTGGFWGVGEERHAVPFKALKSSPEANALTLTFDEKKLTNAPKLKEGMSEAEYSRQVNEYYGQAPSFEGQTQEKGMTGEKENKMHKEQNKSSY